MPDARKPDAMTPDAAMPAVNRRIVLAARPHGEPRPEDFRLEEGPVPSPGPGQVLLRTRWLSLDPYMRGRMSEAKSYAAPVEVGGVITGETVGEVVASNHPDHAVGDLLTAFAGWQTCFVTDAAGSRRVDPALAPPSTALGILGMPGMTAWAGLHNIGRPKAGETVVVAAAAGPVGSLVGQIARLRGARAVGIAGGPDKVRLLTEAYGFDAAVDHRGGDLTGALAAACPDGIDVYFENVGGAVFEAVLPLLNPFARVPVCGLVSAYNAVAVPPGPDRLPGLMRAALTKRLHVQGFIVWDFADQEGDFRAEVGGWLSEGRVAYREDVVEGLENAPGAFIGMLRGRNVGKTLVRMA